MSIFSGLFKSRDKPQNRTAGSNYAFFLGGTTFGKTVTERSAMQMTAVYSASVFCLRRWRDCRFTFTNTRTAAARRWHSTIRSTACSMMSRTQR